MVPSIKRLLKYHPFFVLERIIYDEKKVLFWQKQNYFCLQIYDDVWP